VGLFDLYDFTADAHGGTLRGTSLDSPGEKPFIYLVHNNAQIYCGMRRDDREVKTDVYFAF